jgi:lysophospholipase L1-like esterase
LDAFDGRTMIRLSRGRRWLLGVACLALVGELGLRVVDAFREVPTGSLYNAIQPGPSRFRLRPGTHLRVPERYGTIEYRLNRCGYRDAEWSDRPADVVLLGDSVGFGLGAPQDRIFAEILETDLRRRIGREIDVRNLSVFAYHTRDEVETFREDALAMRPQVVVLQFYMNDLSAPGAESRRPAARPPLRHALRALWNRFAYSSNLYRRLHQGVARTSYLLLHDLRRQRFPHTLNHAEVRHKSALLAAQPDDLQIAAFREILTLRDLVHAAGAELLVAVFPDEIQLFEPQWDGIDRRMAAFLTKAGIAHLFVVSDLRSVAPRERVFLDGVHLSGIGHTVAGRALAERIAPLLPMRAAP